MVYKKIYKLTIKTNDEKRLPTEDDIKRILGEVPADVEYSIDVEDVMDCENCMCAIIDGGKIYCNLHHTTASGAGCNWWKRDKK